MKRSRPTQHKETGTRLGPRLGSGTPAILRMVSVGVGIAADPRRIVAYAGTPPAKIAEGTI